MINTSNIPSNLANVVTPFSAPGSKPVGQESSESKNTPFKPVVELSETARTSNRREQLDLSNLEGQKNLVQERGSQQQGGGNSENQSQENRKSEAELQSRAQDRVTEQQAVLDRKAISELAARDREVRVHEQAHKSAGGSLTGAASYQYERGPDGKSYAVSGEVPIKLSSGGSPEETKAIAQRVQQAALAPAEPSSQDRQVAAQAAQIEQEATQQIAALAQQEAELAREQAQFSREERLQAEEARREREAEDDEPIAASNEQANVRLEQVATKSIDLNQKLIDIGLNKPVPDAGSLINQSA